MSPAARFYLINERVILGGFMLIVVLLAWEGLSAAGGRASWSRWQEPRRNACGSNRSSSRRRRWCSKPLIACSSSPARCGATWPGAPWATPRTRLRHRCRRPSGPCRRLVSASRTQSSRSWPHSMPRRGGVPPLIVIWVGTGMGARVHHLSARGASARYQCPCRRAHHRPASDRRRKELRGERG